MYLLVFEMLRLVYFLFFVTLVCGGPGHNVGRLKVSSGIGPRIVNGATASLGQFPWQAALYVDIAGTTYFCAGVIISEEWILSSGSCLDEVESAVVQTGIVDLDSNDGTLSYSAEVIIHEEYDPWIMEHSIGLVRLSQPLEFNVNTQPILLQEERIGAGVEVVVSGWGAISDDNPNLVSILNYAFLNTIDNQECEEIYGQNSIFEEDLCAVAVGDTAKGPCGGDTGGPLVASINTTPRLVGVVDFISDHGCESGHPAGFTRISSYREWVREKSGV